MPLAEECLPCHIQYDNIVTLEAQLVNSTAVINNHLGPYFRGTYVHNNKKGGGAICGHKHGRILSQYANLTQENFQKLLAKGLHDDMTLFGYTYLQTENLKQGITAYCLNREGTTECC